MHIGINTLSVRHHKAGIGTYAQNLIRALATIDCVNRYTLFLNPENAQQFQVHQANFSNVVVQAPFKKFYLWEHFYLPFAVWTYHIDVLHGVRFVLPLISRARTVVTVHDLAFHLFPGIAGAKAFNYWEFFVPKSLASADYVIAVSQHTRNDLIRHFRVPGNRIAVTYEGCDERFTPIHDPERLKPVARKYGLPDRFLLFVGTLEPRKNLEVLLQAIHHLKSQTGGSLSSFKLVIVGKKGWLYSKLFQRMNELHLNSDVIFTGYVDEEDLPMIYNLAHLFVYPSKYEGFGLPLLEAMSCGVPVVAAGVSSIPEVVGDAALLFDPEDPFDLAGCILKLESPKLRDELIAKGLAQKAKFSWQKAAEEALRVYEKVFQGEHP